MKKQFIYLAAFIAFTVASCTVLEDKSQVEKSRLYSESGLTTMVENGVLSFNSMNEFGNTVDALKSGEACGLNIIPATKSDDGSFVSLRESLVEKGLKEFTDEELAMIQEKGLTYEPEDELIKDPNLIVVLNQDRQVKIGEKVYTFVDVGVIVTDPDEPIDHEAVSQIGGSLEHGEAAPVGNKGGYVVAIDYNQPTLINGGGNDSPMDFVTDEPTDGSAGGSTGGGSGSGGVSTRPSSLKLDDGIVIAESKIRRIEYVKDGGDGSWLTKFVNNLAGTSVLAHNYYDDGHRMVLRMFSQDYIIYRSIGMSLRMQERFLGIWWRKKADEFRYGWTNIECEYTYDAPNPFAPLTKSPDVINKNLSNCGKTAFYYVPFDSYDKESGYIEDVVSSGLEVQRPVKDSYEDYRGTGFGNNKNSVYTIKFDKDKAYVYVVYPQGEEVAYNTGKEKVRWGYEAFYGNYTAGILGSGGSWSLKDMSIKSTSTQEIKRGRIYGAVKYDGEWRACVIETVD